MGWAGDPSGERGPSLGGGSTLMSPLMSQGPNARGGRGAAK
jgi:hypothetical protein